jgi:TfoX/Sxy family transcriptional regulator of competence genes
MPGKPKAAPSGVDPRLARIAREYAADRRVSLGKLFASHGLRVDGKIFAMVVRGKLVVKLPRSRVDELVASGIARRFDPGHGRLMKEWAELEGARPPWSGLVDEAHQFVGGLRAATKLRSRARAR